MRQSAAARRRTTGAVFLQEQTDFTSVDRAAGQAKMVRLISRCLCNVMSYGNTGLNTGVVEPEIHKIWEPAFKNTKKY